MSNSTTTEGNTNEVSSSTGTLVDASFQNRAIAHLIDIGVYIGIAMVGGIVLGFIKLGFVGFLLGLAYFLVKDSLPFFGWSKCWEEGHENQSCNSRWEISVR